MGADRLAIKVQDLDDNTLIAMQDPLDERYIFLRSIEKIVPEEFYNNLISGAEKVESDKNQAWDIDLNNRVASKVCEVDMDSMYDSKEYGEKFTRPI